MILNKIIIITIVIALSASMACGATKGVIFNVAKGDKEYDYYKMINTDIESIGYTVSDQLERINDGYKEEFGQTNLDNIGFFSIANYKALHPLLLKAPELGAFSPFNLHIYKKTGEDKSHIGHIMPSAMLDIMGVKDKDVRTEFIAMFSSLDRIVQEKIGGVVEFVMYDKLPAETMIEFELMFEHPKELDEYIDKFQENFEAVLEDKNYTITGYRDFRRIYNDLGLEFDGYDAYFVYTFCSFEFSEAIFNQGRPDAGVFAPCSIYMYIEKGSNRMVIGMPRVENWAAVMGINDKKMLNEIHALDKEIVSILKALGAKEIGAAL